jgi:tRNA G37 N-methylase Trm5
MTISPDVAAQIDAAFDFRGHVTVTLTDGSKMEGFLFNRELKPLKGEPYVEVIPKDSDERVRVPAAKVKAVSLTGKDFAVPFVPPPKG